MDEMLSHRRKLNAQNPEGDSSRSSQVYSPKKVKKGGGRFSHWPLVLFIQFCLLGILYVLAIHKYTGRTSALTPTQGEIKPLRKSPHKQNDTTSYRYELSAVVMFRVNFAGDLLNFSYAELRQWMSYMMFAGVEHFYAYDNCRVEGECATWLEDMDPSLVTYQRWDLGSDAVAAHKATAYMEHFQRKPTPEARYEIICDIDEYPFMPRDTERGFLVRFAQNMEEDQTLIRSWFFGGPPDDTSQPWRNLRYLHREMDPYQLPGRTKYIYRTAMVDPYEQNHVWAIHWLKMKEESRTWVEAHKGPKDPTVDRLKADPAVIRLNHYWCERITKSHKELVFDDSIRQIVDQLESEASIFRV